MAWLDTLVRMDSMSVQSLFFYVVLSLTIAPIIFWIIRRQQRIALIEKLPGPKALPILGNALDVNVDPKELFLKLLGFTEYGKSSRIWLGTDPYILITGAAQTEVILSSNRHIDKSKDYNYLHPWLGTGLLTSTGKKWHSRRKLLTPAFHFNILDDFIEVFNQQSNTLIKNLSKKKDGEVFDIFPYCTLCALDIILETAMGINLNLQDNSESEYVKAVYGLVALIQHRQARPWIQPNILFKLLGYAKKQDEYLNIIHGFSNSCIKKRREEFRANKNKPKVKSEDDDIGKKRRLALLDLLLEYSEGGDGEMLSNQDIREEVDTFMFEGHDTTAAAINWSLYLLATNPEIQARVHEELDELFGDSDRPATMKDLKQMKLLENCIKEALRLFPSVPFIGRELKEEVLIDGYRIPTGTSAMIITYKLHRDPEQFPNPEVFDPDRFTPENSAKRHPYAYVPFSAGPRNCIGQKFALLEEKTVISSVLRNFRFESDVRREDLNLLGELILRPEDGTNVKIFKR